ncbi:hypothetical protein C4J81_05145 [Deltaproteobacteria bacterium Smac51]|nr:hypothetical protein C4J81_05145 [Deltaproteobacteria bacterium Smac51]
MSHQALPGDDRQWRRVIFWAHVVYAFNIVMVCGGMFWGMGTIFLTVMTFSGGAGYILVSLAYWVVWLLMAGTTISGLYLADRLIKGRNCLWREVFILNAQGLILGVMLLSERYFSPTALMLMVFSDFLKVYPKSVVPYIILSMPFIVYPAINMFLSVWGGRVVEASELYSGGEK